MRNNMRTAVVSMICMAGAIAGTFAFSEAQIKQLDKTDAQFQTAGTATAIEAKPLDPKLTGRLRAAFKQHPKPY